MEAFKNKTVRVIVCNQAGSTRLMMSSALRAQGFANTIAVPSLGEAMGILTKEPTWLISSLYAEDKVNGLQILALSREHAELVDLRVSLFVTEAEDVFLPRAFALGLLSSHRLPFNKAEFMAATAGVLTLAESLGWNEAFTTAVFIRDFFRGRGEPEHLLPFEAALVDAYPGEARLLLALAEALFEAADDGRARSLLWQAEQREPALEDAARALSDQYLGKLTDRPWANIRPGICVVIDPDETALTSADDALAECGAAGIFKFTSGDDAWAWLEANDPPAMVLMEWRIPKVSGPALLQRMREGQLHLPLVIVNSSLVGKKDLPLLQEMGVTTVLEKPTNRSDFLNCLAWTIEQAHRPTERLSFETRIRALLGAGEFDDAVKLMQLYLARSDLEEVSRLHLEAEFAFHVGDFEAARSLGVACMQAGGKAVVILNLLGKALVKLGDHQAALKVFGHAQEISPNSIERLCAIAESQCALGEDERALATVDKAAKIDADSQTVINSTVNIGLATGDQALVTRLIDRVRPTDSVLAYINNRAVAYAKAADFAQSIDLYGKALAAIPADKAPLRAIVLYNQALTQIQVGDTAGAISSLDAARTTPDLNLRAKVASLLERAVAALKAGRPLTLNQRETTGKIVNPAAAKFAAIVRRVGSRPVAARTFSCCAGIYRDETEPNELVEALLQNLPHFNLAGRST